MTTRPSRLEEFTLPLVLEIAASGLSENDWFDLKSNLQPAEHQRKVVAAFANTQGGFLVFGVNNTRQVVGLDNSEFARDFGNKLVSGLNPSVAFRFSAPLPLSPNTAVWVCEVPKSQRGPHAVLLNEQWVFPKRTESGSNISMSVDEIRAMFLDSGRRANELAWLRAEVERIGELAARINREASVGAIGDLELVLTKFDAGRINTLLVSVFGFISKNSMLVEQMHALIENCERVDAMLGPIVAFSVVPRDRSFSGSRHDWRDFLLESAPKIINEARLVVRWLDEL